jgi:hypothetical protein
MRVAIKTPCHPRNSLFPGFKDHGQFALYLGDGSTRRHHTAELDDLLDVQVDTLDRREREVAEVHVQPARWRIERDLAFNEAERPEKVHRSDGRW